MPPNRSESSGSMAPARTNDFWRFFIHVFFVDYPRWSNSVVSCVVRCPCLLALQPWSLSSGDILQPLVQELCTTQTPRTPQIHQARQNLESNFAQINPTLRPLTKVPGGCRSSWKISWGPDKFIQTHANSTNILK